MPILEEKTDIDAQFDVERDPGREFYFASKVDPVSSALDFNLRINSYESSHSLDHRFLAGFKVYSQCETIPLRPRSELASRGLLEVLMNRASVRSYSTEPIDFEIFSTLLVASYGLKKNGKWLFGPPESADSNRPCPSAGGLYPLEIYPLVFNVQGVKPGVYHYSPWANALEDLRIDLDAKSAVALIPPLANFANFSVVFIVTGVFDRSLVKYGQRAWRFVFSEAGHLAQNLILVGESLGLHSAPIGGADDKGLEELLRIDGYHEGAVYLLAMGPSS